MKLILRKYWKEHLTLFSLMLLTACGTVGSSFMQVQVINALVQKDFASFKEVSIYLLIAYGIFLSFTYASLSYQNHLIQTIILHYQEDLTEQMTRISYRDFHQQDVSTYLSWLTNDLKQIENQSLRPFYQLMSGLISASLSFLSLVWIHWSLGLLTLLLTGLLLLLPRIFQGSLRTVSLALSESNEGFNHEVTDQLSAYNNFYFLRRFPYFKKQMIRIQKKLAGKNLSYQQLIAKVIMTGALGNVLSQVSLFVYTAYLIMMDALSVGLIASVAGLGGEIFNSVGNIGQYTQSIQSTGPIFDKLVNFQDLGVTTSIKQADPLDSSIELSALSFSYGEQEVFRNLSYRFEAGKKYAIVGASGSGKSTLFRLILGLEDEREGLSIGHKNHANLSADSLYQTVGVVEQDPYFMEDSLRENLCLGQDYSIDDLLAILAFVLSLPQGLDTPIKRSGVNWSGGQLQRLA